MTDPKPQPGPLTGAIDSIGRAVYGSRWDEQQAAHRERIAAAARAEVRQARRDRITQTCATVFVLGCLLATLAILTAGAVWAWRTL